MNKKRPYVPPLTNILCIDKEAILQTFSKDTGSGGNASENDNPPVDAKETPWGDTWESSDEPSLWDY